MTNLSLGFFFSREMFHPFLQTPFTHFKPEQQWILSHFIPFSAQNLKEKNYITHTETGVRDIGLSCTWETDER